MTAARQATGAIRRETGAHLMGMTRDLRGRLMEERAGSLTGPRASASVSMKVHAKDHAIYTPRVRGREPAPSREMAEARHPARGRGGRNAWGGPDIGRPARLIRGGDRPR